MPRMIIVMFLTLAYATVRYNVCKGEPWANWPGYVVNKALGLGTLALLVWVLALKRRGRPISGSTGSALAGGMLAHVFVSLTILTPAYFPKYFHAATFTPAAGFSWLLGALACGGVFAALRRGDNADRRARAVLGFAGATVGLHAALLGFRGWFEPATWPGHLPPITLLAAVLGAAALALGLAPRRHDPSHTSAGGLQGELHERSESLR